MGLQPQSPIEQKGVSKNSGTPQSSILIGVSIINFINHPFWGVSLFWKHPYGDLV